MVVPSFQQTFQRALVLGCLGLLAGGLHSALRAPIATKSDKEAALRAALAASQAGGQDGGKASGQAGGQTAGQAAGEAASGAAGAQPTGAASAGAGQVSAAPAALGLEISLADAKRLFDGGALFVDARRRDEFLELHVEGAFLLPADIFAAATPPQALSLMDQSQTLVIYCGGGACDASHNTAFQLSQRGFRSMHIMTDGLPAWTNANYPTASGVPFYEVGGGS